MKLNAEGRIAICFKTHQHVNKKNRKRNKKNQLLASKKLSKRLSGAYCLLPVWIPCLVCEWLSVLVIPVERSPVLQGVLALRLVMWVSVLINGQQCIEHALIWRNRLQHVVQVHEQRRGLNRDSPAGENRPIGLTYEVGRRHGRATVAVKW